MLQAWKSGDKLNLQLYFFWEECFNTLQNDSDETFLEIHDTGIELQVKKVTSWSGFTTSPFLLGAVRCASPQVLTSAWPGHQRAQGQQEQSFFSPNTDGCSKAVSSHGTAGLTQPQGSLRATTYCSEPSRE